MIPRDGPVRYACAGNQEQANLALRMFAIAPSKKRIVILNNVQHHYCSSKFPIQLEFAINNALPNHRGPWHNIIDAIIYIPRKTCPLCIEQWLADLCRQSLILNASFMISFKEPWLMWGSESFWNTIDQHWNTLVEMSVFTTEQIQQLESKSRRTGS